MHSSSSNLSPIGATVALPRSEYLRLCDLGTTSPLVAAATAHRWTGPDYPVLALWLKRKPLQSRPFLIYRIKTAELALLPLVVPSAAAGVLEIGPETMRGIVHDRNSARFWPVARLDLPGPGMRSLPHRNNIASSQDRRHYCPLARQALGDGAFERLQTLKLLILGSGSVGALIAEQLLGYGCAVWLSDTEPLRMDDVGQSSVLFSPADVGRMRSKVFAERYKAVHPHARIIGITMNPREASLQSIISTVDVIVTTFCSPQSRLAIAISSYNLHKVLIDIDRVKTSCPYNEDQSANLHLFLPGETEWKDVGAWITPFAETATRLANNMPCLPHEKQVSRGVNRSFSQLLSARVAALIEDVVIERLTRSTSVCIGPACTRDRSEPPDVHITCRSKNSY